MKQKYLSMHAFKDVGYKPIKDQTKTVTRRLNCRFEVGDIVCCVEKMQGIKQGGHYKKLGYIRIKKIDLIRLYEMQKNDIVKEGFPNMSYRDFIDLFLKINKIKSLDYLDTAVFRIEFEYLSDEEVEDIEWKSKIREIPIPKNFMECWEIQ
ncbi:MAG: hypothetical protein PHS34_08605 [Candidatus Omnitrophica bacterium]|nr:hypothetical protein [Candidatus Omnitrophota bacterium]